MSIRRCKKISAESDMNLEKSSLRCEYEVWDDSNSDNPILLYTRGVRGGYFPGVGDSTSWSSKAYATNVKPTRQAGASSMKRLENGTACFVWRVVIEFSAEIDEEETEDLAECSISTSTEFIEEAYACDLNGTPNCNSHGDLFADPLMIPRQIRVYNINRRLYFNPEQMAINYIGKVNLSPFCGLPSGTVLCADINFSHTYRKPYWDVNYVLKYNHAGWQIQKADSGFFHNEGRFLNEDQSPRETPGFLDGYGNQLAVGADVYFLSFDVRGSANFSGLFLPNIFSI